MKDNTMARRGWIAGIYAVLGLAVLAGCGGGGNGLGQTQAQTPPPSSNPVLTTISVQGTFNPATGQFTQTQGTFQKFTGTLIADPAPPTDTFPPTPDSGAGGALYAGTYTLNSGERGAFNFFVLPDNSAEGLAVPSDFFRYQTEPTATATGTATVSVRLNGSTGSGAIRLSDGTQGAIQITGKATVTAQIRAARQRVNGK